MASLNEQEITGGEMDVEFPPVEDPDNIIKLDDYKNRRDLDFSSTAEIPSQPENPQPVPEKFKTSLKEQVDSMLEQHKEGKEKRLVKGFKDNNNQAWDKLTEKAPVFTNKELENERGEIVNFDQATNYDQLFTMIRKEGVIKNDLQQEVPAETIIDDILKLTYQDIRDFDSTDWTRITLRHNLRKTVAKLIRQYKESEEFKMLGGLDWYGVYTLAGIKKEILKQKLYKNANGEMVNNDVLLRYIDEGQVDLLPEVIRLRVKEVAGLSKTEVLTKSVKGVTKKAWRSFKSWFK